MFGVADDMWWEGVEGEHVGDFDLFLALDLLHFLDNVGVDDFLTWQEVVSHLLFGEMEFDDKFS